jgi:hypothetical protein
MSYSISIQDEAIIDMQETFEWYETQREGLGYEFIKEVENCLSKISLHPEYYIRINDKYRRIKTNRFPYLLVYEIEENKVFIIGVRHESRKPK